MIHSLKILLIGILMLPVLAYSAKNIAHSQRCENAFIGHGYTQSLEKPCRIYWQRWTAEIKKGMPDTH